MGFETKLREDVFADGVSFESCHASTLLALPGGEVLAAWFAGTREGADDVAIWASRRTEDVWTAPVKLADEEGQPHWNPVLFQSRDGNVWMFYKAGKTIEGWKTMYLLSEDDGHTWTAPRVLVEDDCGGRGPVKNKPIVLHDGTWAAPASIELDTWEAFVDLSRDNGLTWTAGHRVWLDAEAASAAPVIPATASDALEFSVPKAKGVIQPTLWESERGIVHMLLRSSTGFICRSDSADGGRTWSPAYKTGLPNNNSGIDLVRMDSGTLALVYNPVGQNWGKRSPLVISLSRDNGATWGETVTLEDAPGEYSYPAIVSAGEDVFVTYTWKRSRIVFCQLNVTP
ncbi:sialidase family protein [Paenibacillus ginsengarvi]|uniref:Neuraminidase (Sialidase) n=1 Tax=Paenibacillus ginsengarvi TaxID=400777 RepID=A0A3B0C6X3_9BACL|nr:sialidase family protein [Paenibacillus ginsengarvi]RKN81995.1 neuraminidase (sialidase) [Paenibacillus ginsengarvi]